MLSDFLNFGFLDEELEDFEEGGTFLFESSGFAGGFGEDSFVFWCFGEPAESVVDETSSFRFPASTTDFPGEPTGRRSSLMGRCPGGSGDVFDGFRFFFGAPEGGD